MFRARSEVRLARARAALELGDAARARAELKLIVDPHLASAVANLRGELAWAAPNASELQLELAGRTDNEALLLRALANCQLVTHSACLRLLTTWLIRPSGKGERRDLELRARTERLKVGEQAGAERVIQDDYRWLALKRPHTEAGQNAPVALGLKNVRLSSTEQTERLVALAEADALSLFDEELVNVSQTKVGVVRYVEIMRARAFALHRARESEKAVLAFDELARFEPERAVEYGYYAARSLARQNLDRGAVERYSALARGKGPFADHAQYQLARLKWQLGQQDGSIAELESYLRRRGKNGKNIDRAEYDLAIFRLAAEDGRGAALRLSQLLNKANDAKERARVEELLGVAHELQSDPVRAEELYRRAMASDPLSLAATLAAARLARLGRAPPAQLEPGESHVSGAPPLELPDAVRQLDEIGLSREAENALYQLTHDAQRIGDAERKQAECSLFSQLERAERAYRLAQLNASARELRYVPEGPHRWHWECLFPTPHPETVQTAAAETLVPRSLIYAIMRQESAFRSEVVSPAGAIGLMQLMPQTANRVASLLDLKVAPSELRAPGINVQLGARYLSHLSDLFLAASTPHPGAGDLEPVDLGRLGLLVLAYNAGPHAVRMWLDLFGNLPIDVFFAVIPYEETRNYGYRVLGNLARYEVLEFGRVRSQLSSLETPKALPLPTGTF